MYLPLVLTLPATVFAIVGQGLFGLGWGETLAGSGGGFLSIKAAQIWGRWRHGREVLGSGDAFLMLSLGALIGSVPTFLGIAVACCLGFILLRFGSHERIAFGSCLTAGCMITWLTSCSILRHNL